MTNIVSHLFRELVTVFEQHRDPRVQHLPFINSPFLVVCILLSYLTFVLHYGPKWMANRKPFDLKYTIRVYNAIQVLANVVLFVTGISNSIFRKEFSMTCQPIDNSNIEPWMKRLVYISYGYYLTKYLDLLDTIFFVLRKKNNQITFLHVYHHAGMIFAVHVFMTFMAGSHSTMLGVINLFIHTVMYSYYFVTSVRPVKQALWWKRHITQLQLLQFGYLMGHFLLVIVRNDCQHPVLVAFVGLIQNLFMFALFFDFYYKEYIRKPQREQQQQQERQKRQQQWQEYELQQQQQQRTTLPTRSQASHDYQQEVMVKQCAQFSLQQQQQQQQLEQQLEQQQEQSMQWQQEAAASVSAAAAAATIANNFCNSNNSNRVSATLLKSKCA